MSQCLSVLARSIHKLRGPKNRRSLVRTLAQQAARRPELIHRFWLRPNKVSPLLCDNKRDIIRYYYIVYQHSWRFSFYTKRKGFHNIYVWKCKLFSGVKVQRFVRNWINLNIFIYPFLTFIIINCKREIIILYLYKPLIIDRKSIPFHLLLCLFVHVWQINILLYCCTNIVPIYSHLFNILP